MTVENLFRFVLLVLCSIGLFIASPICMYRSAVWRENNDSQRSDLLMIAGIVMEVAGVILTVVAVTIFMYTYCVAKG